MTDVLFVTVDGGGNLPPTLAIAGEIARRGGRVRFLGNRVQRARIESAGFAFQPYTRGLDFDAITPRSLLRFMLDWPSVFADAGFAADAIEAAGSAPTDAVVVDALLWRTLADTVRAGLPVVQLVHMFSGFAATAAAGPAGLLARLHGVDAPAALRAPARTIVTTRTEFDAKPLPRVRHTGFVWQGTPVEATPAATPRILVSFSTHAIPGQRAVLQRVIDALAPLDAEVIVTTGVIDPDTLRPAVNTAIRRFVDHGELLPRTSLVIGHGGHSTVARALSHGIPVLVLPMSPLMDQPLVGKAVQRRRVGFSLPKSSSPAKIRDTAVRLLTDETVRSNARALGRDIRTRDGAAVAADLLDAFVGAGR